MQKNLGSVNQNVMVQGTQQGASIPHPQGLRTDSAHSGHAPDGGNQHAVRLFRCLIPQNRSQGPSIILQIYHRQNSFGESGQYYWGNCWVQHIPRPHEITKVVA